MISFNARNASDHFKHLTRMYNIYQHHQGTFQNLIYIHPKGIPVFFWYDKNFAENIRNCRQSVVAIDMLFEGLIIKELLRSLPKDKKYIIFSNATWEPNIDLGFEYILISYHAPLVDFSDRWLSTGHHIFQNNAYQYDDEKSNIFCSLIGVKKPPRDKFVAALTSGLGYRNYILNYHGRELGQPSRVLDIDFDFDRFSNFRCFLHDQPGTHTVFFSLPVALFDSSRISLVVETSQMEDDFHLTEKTLRPLFIGQPFVTFASPYFLKNLRSLGFGTFGDLWSEEYDEILDLDQRINAIIDLLNNMKDFDWVSMRPQLESITNHNRSMFLNLRHVVISKQMEKIEQALTTCTWITP